MNHQQNNVWRNVKRAETKGSNARTHGYSNKGQRNEVQHQERRLARSSRTVRPESSLMYQIRT